MPNVVDRGDQPNEAYLLIDDQGPP